MLDSEQASVAKQRRSSDSLLKTRRASCGRTINLLGSDPLSAGCPSVYAGEAARFAAQAARPMPSLDVDEARGDFEEACTFMAGPDGTDLSSEGRYGGDNGAGAADGADASAVGAGASAVGAPEGDAAPDGDGEGGGANPRRSSFSDRGALDKRDKKRRSSMLRHVVGGH
eukprot:2089513-Prymnesium_polylepis.1